MERNRPQLEPYEKPYARSSEAAVRDAWRRGYALMPVNVVPYVSGVGVAIPAGAGTAHTALCVSALSDRLLQNRRYRQVARLLREEAMRVAAACETLAR
jgi:DNA-binding IclR family transcriptional regulator